MTRLLAWAKLLVALLDCQKELNTELKSSLFCSPSGLFVNTKLRTVMLPKTAAGWPTDG